MLHQKGLRNIFVSEVLFQFYNGLAYCPATWSRMFLPAFAADLLA